ncbi:MAG: hypothetical protein P0S95_04025 [Rhabdochlamydiaceae bacterium]|nr:hypothetical protein [Candidatus Amphrikana amoebophyrae]
MIRYLLVSLLFCTPLCAKKHIFCIHGFMRGKGCMKAIEMSLRYDRHDVINWDYQSKQKTIEEHANDLVLDLIDYANQYPRDEIDFVTHSLGAIIVRSAINHPDCPDLAKRGRAVLIAPPNQGSILARKLGKISIVRRWFGDHAGRELIETEEGGFDRYGPFPMSMDLVIIAGTLGYNPMLKGPNDGKVLTKETRLNRPHEYMEVKGDHSWIAYHPSVVKKVREFYH